MKRLIIAASEPDSALDEKLDDIKADFDYAVDGLDKLNRMGLEKAAITIAEELHNSLLAAVESISDAIIN